MKRVLSLFLCALLFVSCAREVIPAYMNEKLPFEYRAADLLSRMTLEEKVAQLEHESAAVERLNIPAYNWWNEALHGVARAGRATVFPQAIGMGATWDTELIHQVADAISDEARAKHHHSLQKGQRGIYQGLTFWSPNINLFRDPRWGRGMETYGEDPYLTGELGVSFITGLQGDDPKYLKTIATAKHFVVHSGPESTRHRINVSPSLRDFYESYAPHFKKAVQQGGVYSIMCAYQRLYGDPCCGSVFLTDLLRKEWGFDGYVVSDCGAFYDFYFSQGHHVAANKEQSAVMGIKAGTDLNCGDSYRALTNAVQKGLVEEALIDTAVNRLLLARFRLGMFDNPEHVPFSSISMKVVESEQHVSLSRQTARESMVLLENNGILPFSKEVQKVAVIGPNAHDEQVLLANYNGFPSEVITPLEGIRAKLPHAQVRFAQGCALAPGLPFLETVPASVLYTDSTLSRNGLMAKYYNNLKMEGDPIHAAEDSCISFCWWDKAPFEDMDPLGFSVQWTGVLCVPESGTYALGGEGFSGFSLSLDGQIVAQRTDSHEPRPEYEYVQLEGGRLYSLTFSYIQNKSNYALARFLWETPKKHLKREAIDLAKESDLVVLCLGLSPQLEGEQMKVKVEGFDGGDRQDIRLPATQIELIKAIAKLDKPTVLVLLNGSAVTFDEETRRLPAILEAWYPGQEGGNAIADVLFGDYNPGGKLPVTFYQSIDQIPAFDNYAMEGKTYRFFRGTPLYPFGYGLSYTEFDYQMTKFPKSVACGIPVDFTVKVTNVGNFDGDEVIQVYVSLPDASNPVPIKSLQGFKRIRLKAGESKNVTFTLLPEQMASLDENNMWVVEEGQVQIEVGQQLYSVQLIGDAAIIPR